MGGRILGQGHSSAETALLPSAWTHRAARGVPKGSRASCRSASAFRARMGRNASGDGSPQKVGRMMSGQPPPTKCRSPVTGIPLRAPVPFASGPSPALAYWYALGKARVARPGRSAIAR
ncbi:hypothetical protein roselon_00575 [Roseibacterium elongatum DSM 19469]|uniref:Uncharacterized protein n=1 Tax=Roseicyclus elongatus DSM 19469 TaxID=1294273 RepID=W8SKH9_9RHOB|nr:hypothetical protein roselon_00575 [Roseibacterium elongatum DSM 19469]